ncbi:MAG: diacylglycerol kinase [bacterium]|nr:diacylglycerol kinase [bacterium]
MSLKQKIEKFKYPIQGFRIAWQEEPNFRFHITWALLTLLCAYLLRVTRVEFLIIIAMIGFVLVAELFNTALEELCDKFQPTHDPHVAKIKDLAAAAVFAAAMTAVIVGLSIFIPHAMLLFTV